jgi:tetratricopeptide (TPR) repeat protein
MDPRTGSVRLAACDHQSIEMSWFSLTRCRVAPWGCRAGVVLALVCFAAGSFGSETSSPAPLMGKADETNVQDTLRAYLQLQEQLHATQLTIERGRKEADAAANENAKAFAARLQNIEQSLSLQRGQELDVMRSSNKAMLLVAGLFAALGFLAMIFMAYFQWRTISRLAEISAALPVAHAFGMTPPIPAFGEGDGHPGAAGQAQRSNQRLLGTIEQLEKRIHQLEHLSQPTPPPAAALVQGASNSAALPDANVSPAAMGEATASTDTARITVLLSKGQSLLNLDQADEALACFDQVLALDANHPEALVKKGAALERLQRLDEAIACYDRAIAADNSLTVAYLYKGGLFNRMERFGEAIACYEQALRTQENHRG